MKLLLDENLSPAVAVALIADGVDAYHLRDRGILGATDQELLERAYQEDRVLVTSNVDDFAKLVRAREIHAGIVLIERAGLLRDEQIEMRLCAVSSSLRDAATHSGGLRRAVAAG